jgi:hypothetical protein
MRIKLTSPYLYRALLLFLFVSMVIIRKILGTWSLHIKTAKKGITEPLKFFFRIVNHKTNFECVFYFDIHFQLLGIGF